MGLYLLFEWIALLAHALGPLLDTAFLTCVASPFHTGRATFLEVGMVEALINGHGYSSHDPRVVLIASIAAFTLLSTSLDKSSFVNCICFSGFII